MNGIDDLDDLDDPGRAGDVAAPGATAPATGAPATDWRTFRADAGDAGSAGATGGTGGDPGVATPPGADERRWRLLRGRDGIVGGVCTGLARASGVDVILVRIAFVLAALSGFGVLAYLALVLLVPREEPGAGVHAVAAPPETARWIKAALAIGAFLGLTSSLGEWPYAGFPLDDAGGALGLMLVVGGVVVLLSRRGVRLGAALRSDPGAAAPQAPAPPPPPAAPWPTGADGAATDTWPWIPDPGRDAPARDAAPPAERTRRRWGVILARFVAAVAAICGSLTLVALLALDAAGALSVGLPLLVGALLVLGTVGVIATSAVAPPLWPTAAAVGVLLAGGGLAAVTSDWAGHVGDREVVVTSPDQLAERYDLAIGALTLDLAGLDLDGDAVGEPEEVAVVVDGGIGRVDVIVPDDVRLVAEADVSIGEVDVPRDHAGGVSAAGEVDDPGTARATGARGTVRLDLELGIGEVAVCRAADVAPGADRCP